MDNAFDKNISSQLYEIPRSALFSTEKVLQSYGEKNPACEGIVYWAGTKNDNIISVELVIAPKARSFPQRVSVSNDSNAEVIKLLHSKKKQHFAQVHSHPEDWVDHSTGDNEWAAFKHDGLLSVVVPFYAANGIFPLQHCGFHKFYGTTFLMMDNSFLQNNVHIIDDVKSDFIDLR